MSAFIVSQETMHRVVNAIAHRADGPGAWAEMPARTPEHLRRIGQALFDMNAAAVHHRYGHTSPAPIYRWRDVTPYCTPAVRFRAVSCLLYQCSEGDVPSISLYQALVNLRDALAIQIAQKACADMPWDWPEATHTVETVRL